MLFGETGHDAWLRYAPVDRPVSLPAVVATTGESPLVVTARQELIRGVRGMLGRTLRIESLPPREGAIVLRSDETVPLDGYSLRTATISGFHCIVVSGNGRGVLYGVFTLLRKIALGESLENFAERDEPYAPVRWVNHWDNLDGSIERGYGGRSIFWDNGKAREDLSRVSDYGRLLASIGINACSINNVNADRRILLGETFPQIARIAAAFRPWGVKVVISVDFGSPQSVGGLATFDPLDPKVAAWWKSRVDELYAAVPDLGGFVMKADSEGRVGHPRLAALMPTPPTS